MKDIITGIKGVAITSVSEDKLAVSMGSGTLKVFATPAMITLMESSACKCIEPYLDDNETTVGTELNIKHNSSTPKGMKITAEAILTAVNGRELTFDVKAFDECGEIGLGTHKRFIVFSDKFTEKTYSKLNK